MTWDSGGAIILSSIITVVLMWVGSLVARHFDNSHGVATGADARVDGLEKDFLKYQVFVSENYIKASAVDTMRRDIFSVIARLEGKVDRLLAKDDAHG